MKASVIAVLMSLITPALAQEPTSSKGYDPNLAVTVKTVSGKIVEIKGPMVVLGPASEFGYAWSKKVILSNDKRFTAILYSGSKPKYWDAMVFLVGPTGKVSELPQGKVSDIIWSDDSKYIIGIGSNTLRIWNLIGGVRQKAFGSILSHSYAENSLCVIFKEYSSSTGETEVTTGIGYLSIPSLRLIESSTFQTPPNCPNAKANI